jgi:activator of 2-hydroxyglutaryl-CoA dehydratase
MRLNRLSMRVRCSSVATSAATTAKAVVLSEQKELLFHCYANSKGNPIEDAKAILRQIKDAGYQKIGGLAITGYGKDLLKDIIGARCRHC